MDDDLSLREQDPAYRATLLYNKAITRILIKNKRDGFVNSYQKLIRKMIFLGSVWGHLGQHLGQVKCSIDRLQ